jgi:hypothetical protein
VNIATLSCEYGRVCSQRHIERDCPSFLKSFECPKGLNCDYIHNWSLKYNETAKYAILVADAPNHGYKYHRGRCVDHYPNGIEGSESLKELIKAYCKQKIELFAINIHSDADLMFKIKNLSITKERPVSKWR